MPLTRLWSLGGYPDGGVLGTRRFPQWQRDYLTLLAQRDLPAWGLPAKPQVTLRLLRMLAAVNGQAWSATRIGQSLGSRTTRSTATSTTSRGRSWSAACRRGRRTSASES